MELADDQLTADRFPLLTDEGRAHIRRMWDHPHAPTYAGIAGDRLDAPALARVQAYGRALEAPRTDPPPWVEELTARCRRDVPFYRTRGAVPVTRADLQRAPWDFVPDGANLDALIVQRTGGTSGTPLVLPNHPETVAMGVALLRRALATRGVVLSATPGQVAIVQLRFQPPGAATCAMVSAALDGAGFAKVNLHAGEWKDPHDRARYLSDLDPQVYTGTPIAFHALAQLPLTRRPRALISSSQPLARALRAQLETHFGCPVVDVFGLTECNSVAVAVGDAWEILPHDLYVELAEDGEILVTCGRNPYLPLLRYRTGDFATRGADGRLTDLTSRHPIFFAAAGRLISSLEITTHLHDLPILEHAFYQHASGAIELRVRLSAPAPELHARLAAIFGDLPITIIPLTGEPGEHKLVPFSRGAP